MTVVYDPASNAVAVIAHLASIRRQAGLTQAQVAERMPSQTQASVSRFERQKDCKLSSLLEYLAAIGCDLYFKVVICTEDTDGNLSK